MPVKAYRANDPDAPSFPSKFTVVKRAVLQKTDLGANNNKYYNLELHDGGGSFRVFTHYGRTDDLERDPNSGAKESRFFSNQITAAAEYQRIYKEKTGSKKGYKELSLASARVGSAEAQGKSSGEIDEKTKEKLEGTEKEAVPEVVKLPPVAQPVRTLVSYLYQEATQALTDTIKVTITAKGLSTPLGILTIGQIEKGEGILKQIHEAVQANQYLDFERLSSDFYTTIPHKIGRTKEQAQANIIKDLAGVAEKQETLQLMRDMLVVNGEKGGVLASNDVDQKYYALGCTLEHVSPDTTHFREIEYFVKHSIVKTRLAMQVKNIFTVYRPSEEVAYEESLGNHQLLFHGSRIKNWVGILSRGILLPKIVQTMGVHRTDAGWLGNGLYFGDAACTAMFYTSPGSGGSRFLTIAKVALGQVRDFYKITYGLDAAPAGFDSSHGVKRKSNAPSEFDDDEYVVYRTSQQKLKYLVEYR